MIFRESSDIDTNVESGRGSNYAVSIVFSAAPKKGASKSRDPAMLHRYSCRPILRRIVVFTFSSETRLASWIPDNGKNLVPCRTIDRRHFQREDRFFVSHRFAHDAFRFRPYPSASLHRLIFCSFSSVSYSTSSTPVLWTRSVHRKDLFLRSTTQPFVLLYSHVESLRSSVFYFKFRELQCNQGCRPISWIWEKPVDWNVRNNRKESVQNSKLENSSFFNIFL